MSDSLINTHVCPDTSDNAAFVYAVQRPTLLSIVQISKAKVSNINRSPNEPIFPNSPFNDPSPRSLAYSHRRGLRSSSSPSPCNNTLLHTWNSVTSSSNNPNLGNATLSLSHLRTQPDISRGADLCGGTYTCSLSFEYVSLCICRSRGEGHERRG